MFFFFPFFLLVPASFLGSTPFLHLMLSSRSFWGLGGGGEGLVRKVLAVQVGSPEFRFPEPKRKLLSATLPVIPALRTRVDKGFPGQACWLVSQMSWLQFR